MKAKDLRIGNYFQWSVFASMGQGVDRVTKENHYKYEQLREPISLDEEWLVRFGFSSICQGMYFALIDNGESYPDYGFKYTNEYDDNEGFRLELWVNDEFRIGKTINTVHDLQNSYYSLTGEELVLKEKKKEKQP